MLTLPFQILTQLGLNENEADEETESQPFQGTKYGPCLKILTQITLEDGNELAEIREVFPKQLTSELFDYDHKLTLKSFFAFCSVFFFYKDQRRKDGNDFEKDTMPGFQNTPALH